MKIHSLILVFLLSILGSIHGQNEAYRVAIKNAEAYFEAHDYKKAANEYSNAFKVLNWKGLPSDRFNSARTWALSGEKDSAFFQINRLLTKTDYLVFHDLINEKDFDSLHHDKRWQQVLHSLNPNNELYQDSLANVLNVIYQLDQKYRSSNTDFQFHAEEAVKQDSINLANVRAIIDKHGWLSVNEVGRIGNTTLWLVLQHAPLSVMEHYLPVLQRAVDSGKASKKNLAYFQDRILMYQGKPQLYGTQYKILDGSVEMKLWDVAEPENLDKRRASMGLQPMNSQNN